MELRFLNYEYPDNGGEREPELAQTQVLPVFNKPPRIIPEMDATGEIVIDDDGPVKKRIRKKRERAVRQKKENEGLKSAWRSISPALAALAAVVITLLLIAFAVRVVKNKFLRPVDPSDPTPIVVTIPKSSGASAIAKILYEAGGEGERGLIVNKALFKVYVDFLGRSSNLKAGTYVLSRNMGMRQIVDIICSGNPPRETVKFTISEGMTVEGIAARLVDKGILKSPDRFLELCRDAKSFAGSYQFVKKIVDEGREGRTYMLEGYLFPDTYEVFADATEEEIIVKMLDRFGEIYTRKYVERAEEMGYTLDEVVILASMIEKEAKTFDFNKVSAVFYGRLANDMPLHSDATLGYILKTQSMEFTQEELDTDNPYNTYKYKGLPAGPISNPGTAAMEAVLFPNEQYITEGYLYFCLMDPTTGALAFAKTAEEHAANVEKYKPLWGN